MIHHAFDIPFISGDFGLESVPDPLHNFSLTTCYHNLTFHGPPEKPTVAKLTNSDWQLRELLLVCVLHGREVPPDRGVLVVV